jgi:hypothetical protein
MKSHHSSAALILLIALASALPATPAPQSSTPPAETSKTTPANHPETIEQAIPVAALLRSVKDSDTTLFLQCWDQPTTRKMGLSTTTAPKWLDQYKLGFDKAFGTWSPVDFTFTFTGDANSGTVTATFKDKSLPPLKVVRSLDAWKLAEK